jgi:hypothetical protein
MRATFKKLNQWGGGEFFVVIAFCFLFMVLIMGLAGCASKPIDDVPIAPPKAGKVFVRYPSDGFSGCKDDLPLVVGFYGDTVGLDWDEYFETHKYCTFEDKLKRGRNDAE